MRSIFYIVMLRNIILVITKLFKYILYSFIFVILLNNSSILLFNNCIKYNFSWVLFYLWLSYRICLIDCAQYEAFFLYLMTFKLLSIYDRFYIYGIYSDCLKRYRVGSFWILIFVNIEQNQIRLTIYRLNFTSDLFN